MTRTRQGGFTFLHLMAAIGIGMLTLLALGRTYAATSSLNLESRVHLRANEDVRRNLEAIANTLRGADFGTLAGTNDGAPVTRLTFSNITGMDRLGPLVGPLETIEWRPTDDRTPAGVRLGSIFHAAAGRERLLASRVPEDGFAAALDEGVLRLELSGHYIIRGRSLTAEGSTALLPRN